jgi:hypothetical protein
LRKVPGWPFRLLMVIVFPYVVSYEKILPVGGPLLEFT